MNTPADTTQTETDTRPGEVRTYRGRTVEELIPQIRAELGPGAMILRERQGLTGGVGGFFAKRCVEIDAQSAPRLSVYADDEDESMAAPAPTPDPFAGFAARLEQAAAGGGLTAAQDDPFAAALAAPAPAPVVQTPAPAVQTPAPAVPTPAPVVQAPATPAPAAPTPAASAWPEAPAMGDAPRIPALSMNRTPQPAPAGPIPSPLAVPARPAMRITTPAPPAPVPAAAQPADEFIAFDELTADSEPERAPEPEPELAPVSTSVFKAQPIEPAPAREPEPEPVELTVPILLDVAPAAADPDSVFRPRPLIEEGPVPMSAFRAIVEPVAPLRLRDRLAAHGLSDALVDKLTDAAEDQDEATARTALAALLPDATPLPLDGGLIAVVGAPGSGKTRAVAALAAACARDGHTVTVARLAGADRDDELAALLEDTPVEVVPVMKTKATVRAISAARDEDLVILDTPSTMPGEDTVCEALAETLGRFSPDAVLLCAPATYTGRALTNLVEHHASLQLDGLIATHRDEAGMLGTVAELSIDTRIPLGHVHSGLDLGSAISSVNPNAIAADLLR